jgi:transposase
MKYKYFVGIDMGKSTMDIAVLDHSGIIVQATVQNTKKAIDAWLGEMKTVYKLGGMNTLFCMESVDTYSALLIRALKRKTCELWQESALRIKLSLGLQRGKSDKIDALRIAQHAQLFKENYIAQVPPRDVIVKIRSLNNLKSRIGKAIRLIHGPIKEKNSFASSKLSRELPRYYKTCIAALKSDMDHVEHTISDLIQKDARLSRLSSILTSIDGVGKVLSLEVIIHTNEFRKFNEPRKFACHCGLAPFDRSSGTSLQTKRKVSGIAHRRLKTCFHLPAMAATRVKGELQDYYKRKVAEGKPKMSVLNAIKNKLVHRMFVCVNEDRMYLKVPPSKKIVTDKKGAAPSKTAVKKVNRNARKKILVEV